MRESLILIEKLEKKINLIISQRDKLAKDNFRLSHEREGLLEERSKHTKQINELKEELKNIRLAFDMTADGERDRAKRRIEAILREIDVCIELINKK